MPKNGSFLACAATGGTAQWRCGGWRRLGQRRGRTWQERAKTAAKSPRRRHAPRRDRLPSQGLSPSSSRMAESQGATLGWISKNYRRIARRRRHANSPNQKNEPVTHTLRLVARACSTANAGSGSARTLTLPLAAIRIASSRAASARGVSAAVAMIEETVAAAGQRCPRRACRASSR